MPTLKEVAAKAAVSPTTVSHVINKTRFVSPEVEARVRSAMEEIGYQPNMLARALRRGETRTLGLILPDSANPYFAEIGRSIEGAAYEVGYSVILCNTEGRRDKERHYFQVLSEKQVDGLILVSVGDRGDNIPALLRRELPVVVVDRDLSDIAVDVVQVDNLEGGSLATRHLISLGHKRIGCIAGPSHVSPSGERFTGYRDALRAAGLKQDEALVRSGDFHAELGRVATIELLHLRRPPTAIFACNDLMAMGALQAASEMGCRVPEDLAVVGFDDIELAAYTVPPLTTVSQPKAGMGHTAVQVLMDRICNPGGPARKQILPVSLVKRKSCGAIS